MPEDRAASFLQMIRRSQRGRLKIYLGYGPGVGKTYQMLSEGHRLKGDGIDVVLGLVETHGRAETAKLVDGLEQVHRRRVEYHGIAVDEMDVDAILVRKPQVVLVDELAHTNVPGSRNAKRYQDVQDLLDAGIHVITTMNVQHLESLYNTVERLVGVKVRERIPDSVLAEADQVVNVDLAAEDLQKRLREGRIYPAQRVQSSLDNFFTASNLEHLRELTLRELASQLDLKRRETGKQADVGTPTAADPAGAPDQIMVCLSSRGPNSSQLLRYASRLAGRFNRNWYAVYVQTRREDATVIDLTTQRLLSDTLTLANQLGAMVFTFKGEDVADTILRFAREYRVGQIVIGSPRPVPRWRRLFGASSVAEQLIGRARGVSVVVVDVDAEHEPPRGDVPPATRPTALASVTENETRNGRVPAKRAAPLTGSLGAILDAERILVINDPIPQREVLERLVYAAAKGMAGIDPDDVIKLVFGRERQGSTFLNEGVALPHARIPGLQAPRVALALTRGGVLDAPNDRPIESVFLLLSPADGPATHLQILASAGRALQNAQLHRRLLNASTPGMALGEIQATEGAVVARPV